MELNFWCYNLFSACVHIEINIQTLEFAHLQNEHSLAVCAPSSECAINFNISLMPFGYFQSSANIFLGRAHTALLSQSFSQPSFRAVILHMNSQLRDDAERWICGWLKGQGSCFFKQIKVAHSLYFLMVSRRSEWPQSRISGDIQTLEGFTL